MKTVVAKLDLVAELPSGQRQLTVITLYLPNENGCPEKGCATCQLSIEGALSVDQKVHGEDGFQALSMALAYVRFCLIGFIQDGGVWYFLDGETEFELSDYFPLYGPGVSM